MDPGSQWIIEKDLHREGRKIEWKKKGPAAEEKGKGTPRDAAMLKQMKNSARPILSLSLPHSCPACFSQSLPFSHKTTQTAEPKGRSRFSAAAFHRLDLFRPVHLTSNRLDPLSLRPQIVIKPSPWGENNNRPWPTVVTTAIVLAVCVCVFVCAVCQCGRKTLTSDFSAVCCFLYFYNNNTKPWVS